MIEILEPGAYYPIDLFLEDKTKLTGMKAAVIKLQVGDLVVSVIRERTGWKYHILRKLPDLPPENT
jgi:hypothetical protein